MRACAAVALIAWAAAASADPPKHRTDGDAAVAAHRVLVKHCGGCHGADPDTRRGRLDVTDHPTLVGNAGKVAFAAPGAAAESQILHLLEDGSMPPAGRTRDVKPEEVDAVRAWVVAGAPYFPRRFDDDAVLALVAEDLSRQPEKDRGAFRYLSLAHLAAEGKPLADAEAELAAALAPAGGNPFDKLLKPLRNSANTVYRLDLRELRWDATGLFDRTVDGAPADDQFDLVPYDLIQLEYPHPAPRPADKELAAKVQRAVEEMNPHRRGQPLAQLRAVPFVRADWLAKALRKDGKPTPLAEELTALGELAALAPAERRNTPGPAVSRFEGGEEGPAESVWAWHRGSVPKKSDTGLKVDDTVGGQLEAGGGNLQLKAVALQKVHLALIEVWSDDVLKVHELTLGAELEPGKQTSLATGKKPTLFVPQVPGGGNRVYFLVFASTERPKKPPVVVRSRHKESAVWRVLAHEADAAGDGKTLPVARAVVRIDIKKTD